MEKIKCMERYKGFQRKEVEERKAWLKSRGFDPTLSYIHFLAFRMF